MAKYTKGGVLMEYSSPSAEEGGTEAMEIVPPVNAPVPPKPTITQAVAFKDDDNIRLSDLPENYFDDLLDMDFYDEKPKKKENEEELLNGFKIIKDEKLDSDNEVGQKSKEVKLQLGSSVLKNKERIRINFIKDKRQDVSKTTMCDAESGTLNSLKRHQSTSPSESKKEKQTKQNKQPEPSLCIETDSLEENRDLLKQKTTSTKSTNLHGLSIPVVQPGSSRILTPNKTQRSAMITSAINTGISVPPLLPMYTPPWPNKNLQRLPPSNPTVQPLPVPVHSPMISPPVHQPVFHLQRPDFVATYGSVQPTQQQTNYSAMNSPWPPQPPPPGVSPTSFQTSPQKNQHTIKNKKLSPVSGGGLGCRTLAFVQKVQDPPTPQNSGSKDQCGMVNRQGSQLKSSLSTSDQVSSKVSDQPPSHILPQKQVENVQQTQSEGKPKQYVAKTTPPLSSSTKQYKMCSVGTNTEKLSSEISTTAKQQHSFGVQCHLECLSCVEKGKIILRLNKLVDQISNPLLRQTMKSLLDFTNVSNDRHETSTGSFHRSSITTQSERIKEPTSLSSTNFGQKVESAHGKRPLSKETTKQPNDYPNCLDMHKKDCQTSKEPKSWGSSKSISSLTPQNLQASLSAKLIAVKKLSLQRALQQMKTANLPGNVNKNLPKLNVATITSNSNAPNTIKISTMNKHISLQKSQAPLERRTAGEVAGNIGNKKAAMKSNISNSTTTTNACNTKIYQKTTPTFQDLDPSEKSQLTVKDTASNTLQSQKEQHIVKGSSLVPTNSTDCLTSSVPEDTIKKPSSSLQDSVDKLCDKKGEVSANKNQEGPSSTPGTLTVKFAKSTDAKTLADLEKDSTVEDSKVSTKKTKITLPPKKGARGRGSSSAMPRLRGAGASMSIHQGKHSWNHWKSWKVKQYSQSYWDQGTSFDADPLVSLSNQYKVFKYGYATPRNLYVAQKSRLKVKETAGNTPQSQKEQRNMKGLPASPLVPTNSTDCLTSSVSEDTIKKPCTSLQDSVDKLSTTNKEVEVCANINQEAPSSTLGTNTIKFAKNVTAKPLAEESQEDNTIKESAVPKKTKITLPPKKGARGRGSSSVVPRGRGAGYRGYIPRGKNSRAPRSHQWKLYNQFPRDQGNGFDPGPHFNQYPGFNYGPPPNMPIRRGFGNRRARGRGLRRPSFRGRGHFPAPT